MATARRAGRPDVSLGHFQQLRAVASCDGGGRVPACVGDHDHPARHVPHQRVPGSPVQRAQAAGQQVLFVAGRHDDGQGTDHVSPSMAATDRRSAAVPGCSGRVNTSRRKSGSVCAAIRTRAG